MASFRKIGRNWFYRYIDADGIQREWKGCTDRRETEGMAAAAEAEVAKIRSGYIDPKAPAYLAHEARTLADHLADWHSYLTAKGSTIWPDPTARRSTGWRWGPDSAPTNCGA